MVKAIATDSNWGAHNPSSQSPLYSLNEHSTFSAIAENCLRQTQLLYWRVAAGDVLQ